MEQKEFEKRCIALNEEYMQKKVEIEQHLASLKKTRAEIKARIAQQELEYKELGILVQEQETQLRNLNLSYHHERNMLKMQCTDRIGAWHGCRRGTKTKADYRTRRGIQR